MKNAYLEYQRQAITQASPEELVSKLYDMAIQACYKQDAGRAKDILDALIKSLNFEYELSSTLYELYTYCKTILDEDKFEEVRTLIEPIRQAWNEGVVKNKVNLNRVNKTGFLA